jgi:hypothetical protein
MRLAIRKISGKEYVYFLESYREPKTKKPMHKTIKCFGRLDKLLNQDPDILSKLQSQVKEINKNREAELNKEISEYVNTLFKGGEQGYRSFPTRNCGIAVYKHLWQELGLDYLFRRMKSKRKIAYDYERVSFLLSASRIITPMSKLSTYEKRQDFAYNSSSLELQDMYKTLSLLSMNKEEIEKHLHKRLSGIMARSVTVAFYDVSTYRFESTSQDELKGFGYSKDGKPNEVQVTMGLLIDGDGIPLGYEIFPGNTSEFKTMEPVLVRCMVNRL